MQSPDSNLSFNKLKKIIKESDADEITIQIEYREPFFEQVISRKTATPYLISFSKKTKNLDDAVCCALRQFVDNSRNSLVRWQTVIIGINVKYENDWYKFADIKEVLENIKLEDNYKSSVMGIDDFEKTSRIPFIKIIVTFSTLILHILLTLIVLVVIVFVLVLIGFAFNNFISS